MFATIRSGTFGAIGALALASSSVFAAPVQWSAPSGSNSEISWSGGQSAKGLFGDPVVNGSSFLFFPTNFESTSGPNSAQTTSDTLQFQISAAPGKEIKAINIQELGAWSISGIGTVRSTGMLYVTKLTNPGYGTVWKDKLDTTYEDVDNSITYSGGTNPNVDGSGDWTGDFSIALPAGVTSVQIVLNNILQTTAGANSTSYIQKSEIGSPGNAPQFLISVAVPEPASLGVVALAGVALLRRQRKAPSTT